MNSLIESTHSNNKDEIISALSKGAVAEKTYDANEQHYEVPPEFFNQVLGSNLKYSCSLFDNDHSLDEAEKSVDYFNSQIDFWKKRGLKKPLL